MLTGLAPSGLLGFDATPMHLRQCLSVALPLLVPAALLCALFCARRGVERGRALPGGILPGWLFFGALLFAAEWAGGGKSPLANESPALGWLLLTAFAVLRADPPTPTRTGLGWALGAGIMGALSVCAHLSALGGVYGLWLYVCFSAGWRQAVGYGLATVVLLTLLLGATGWHLGLIGLMVATVCLMFQFVMLGGFRWRFRLLPSVTLTANPAAPDPIPLASARRVIGVLLILPLMGAPAVVAGLMLHAPFAARWAFVLVPLALAVGLILTEALASFTCRA